MPVRLPPDFPPAPSLHPSSLHEALAWHDRIGKGVSSTLVAKVAAEWGVPNQLIAQVVYGEELLPRGRPRDLTIEQANALYRFLQLLAGLEMAFGDSRKAALAWLTSAAPELKGRVPLSLARTPMGMEYVRTALTRRSEAG